MKIIFQADEAFHIGPAVSRESYLKMEKIIEVAIQSGAQVMSKANTFISPPTSTHHTTICKSNSGNESKNKGRKNLVL